MTMLVHLIDQRHANSVRRSGLRGAEFHLRTSGETVTLARAVFAMPVLANFYASHQWLRELKRFGKRTIDAVYFRQRSDSMVWVGNYNGEHRFVPLGHAAGLIMKEPDPRGWQLVLPESVPAKAIHEIREVPQVIGWRYFPESHVKGPWKCLCEFCLKRDGSYPKSRISLRRIASDPAVNPAESDNPALIEALRKPVRRKATTRKRREDREGAE